MNLHRAAPYPLIISAYPLEGVKGSSS